MKLNISPTMMYNLTKLFTDKDWELNLDKNIKQSLFHRYCERLRMFEDDGQELFIDLSYRFEQILMKDYLEMFLMSFHLIDEEVLKKKETIIIAPLVNPFVEDNTEPKISPNPTKPKRKLERSKTKSAQFLYYMLHAHDLRWIDYAEKFEFCDTVSEIKESIKHKDVLLILIDDFIGSGGTAVDCCKSIVSDVNRRKHKISFSDVCIVSIAAMQGGIDYIDNEIKVKCYSDIIRQKGITDFFEISEIEEKKEIMRRLEAKMYAPSVCPEKYSLGFKGTEALISFMNKTPNNTFPIFWYETDTKIAPFPRYKNFK